MRTVLTIMVASLFVGCASGLPRYSPMEPREAWGIVQQRAAAIRAVSATADVTLMSADGTSMRVDAALVLAPPDRVRFRAWKAGHAVLDVTGDAGTMWIDSPETPTDSGCDEGLGVAPADLTRGLQMIPAWALSGVQPIRAERGLERYFFELPSINGHVRCEISVRTLIVLRWQMTNADAGTFTLELDDHHLVDGIPFAHEIVLRADDRSVRMRFRNVELTEPANPMVFTPPVGAERVQ